MNVVKNLQEFISFIQSRDEGRDEIVFFPIGVEGQQVVDFLRYTNLLRKVCCIAMPQVGKNNTSQIFIHELPVIPLEHLVHFRETATFIVAGSEQYYQNLNEELTRYGCKRLIFISSTLQAQIQESLQRMASTGQIMMWFLDRFDKKITEMEYRIEEQNEVTAINNKAFAEYQNIFRDKEVVLIANGKTLNYYKVIPDAIHVGVNNAWKRENIPLDFLFVQDGRCNLEQGFDMVRRKVFIGDRVNRVIDDYSNFPKDISIINERVARYCLGEYSIGQRIYGNMCFHAPKSFGSVIFPAFNFALFTCPKKIYLVGCDVADTGHFFRDDTENKFLPTKPRMKSGYAMMKMFARLYYPETEIISINPVGLRGLFKDVYTDEYRKALEEEKNK